MVLKIGQRIWIESQACWQGVAFQATESNAMAHQLPRSHFRAMTIDFEPNNPVALCKLYRKFAAQAFNTAKPHLA